MKNVSIITVLIFSCFFKVKGQNAEQQFYSANQLYLADSIAEAISIYENISNEWESPELYFNLGNAYFKSGELGKSILNYERARRLSPMDKDIKFNLDLAKTRTRDQFTREIEDYGGTWRILLLSTPENFWAVSSIVLALLGGLFLILKNKFANSGYKDSILYSLLFTSLIFLFTLLATFQGQHYKTTHNTGIITSHLCEVMSAPSFESSELLLLHEGTKLRILDENEHWTKVESPDGLIGWIKSLQIEAI